jgi:hypothetical protein
VISSLLQQGNSALRGARALSTRLTVSANIILLRVTVFSQQQLLWLSVWRR